MRRKIVVFIICLLILSSLTFTMGCFEDPDDSDDSDKKKPNNSPHADAGEDITIPTMTEIQFNSTNSSDPDGSIVSYSWDFGDHIDLGQDHSTEANPKYTYYYPGVYIVTLLVTDDDDSNATDTITVTVKNRKPIVEIGEDVVGFVYEIIYFNIEAFDTDGYLTSFEWDFNGDSIIDWHSAAMIPTIHFYDAAGIYNATLTVTDNYGDKTIVDHKITITEPQNVLPIADAGLNQTAHTGQIMLKCTGFDPDGAIVKYEWDFDGDDVFDWNSTSTGIVTHNYAVEGEYLAKVRITDDLGATATDVVNIVIDNSYTVHNVNAEILLNWVTGLDYLILLNDTINRSHLKVVITDISTGDKEEFNSSVFTMINQTSFGLNSRLVPISKHSLDVQVFYYKTLIGARILEIINENHEFIGPGFDYEALYDWDHLMEERERNGVEILKLKSIGDIEVIHKSGLYYYSLHGTGEYYIQDLSEAGACEATINCTSLWINVTIIDTTIISKSVSILGHGTMTIVRSDNMNINLSIEQVRMVIENDIVIENYMFGKGTFSGSTIDPNTGSIIPMEGNATYTTELLGFGFHENRAGDPYPCGIERNDLTLTGNSAIPDSGAESNFPIEMTIVNTTWNVDPDRFSNNTIYYEYTSISNMADMEFHDSGSGYPEDSPEPKDTIVHISEALSLNLPRPRVFLAGDSMMFMSESGVILQLIIEQGDETTIDGENYETIVLNGTIGGSGGGYFKIRMVSSGKFTGLAVHTAEDYEWNSERLTAEVTLKEISI